MFKKPFLRHHPARYSAGRQRPRPVPRTLEVLEQRFVLDTYLVTTVDRDPADPDVLNFDQALGRANSHAGLDTIEFRIPDPGPHIIRPGICNINDPVIIDGTTQPGWSAEMPVIVFDLQDIRGVRLREGGSTIRGLVITSSRQDEFAPYGVYIDGRSMWADGHVPDHNRIEGNFIGYDPTHRVPVPARGYVFEIGVVVQTSDNIIGGTTDDAPYDDAPWPADFNPGNVISQNNYGLLLDGRFSGRHNRAQGNYIGTDFSGLQAIPNQYGLVVANGDGNEIGGISQIGFPNGAHPSTPGRNVISGNSPFNLELRGYSRFNLVQSNFIGPNASGFDAPAGARGDSRTFVGVHIDGASSNTIGPQLGDRDEGEAPLELYNVISGNVVGVQLEGGAQHNVVSANFIGMNSTRTGALANDFGVYISEAPLNLIGGAATGEQIRVGSGPGNWIQGNLKTAVAIVGSAAVGNIVSRNRIGGDTPAQENAGYGVEILDGAYNLIGRPPDTSAAPLLYSMNDIRGNGRSGILVSGSNNQVWNNAIDNNAEAGVLITPETTGEGLTETHDAIHNVIGLNTITNNGVHGIYIKHGRDNEVVHNNIGVKLDDAGRYIAEGNGDDGVLIENSSGNLVRNRNLIGANAGNGIEIRGTQASDNKVVEGNIIGSDPTFGVSTLGNGVAGVVISQGAFSNYVGIGKAKEGTGNVIGWNPVGIHLLDATENNVDGNWIGLSPTDTMIANLVGVAVDRSFHNHVGSGDVDVDAVTGVEASNVISGNSAIGVILRNGAADNRVDGNLIGTSADGSSRRDNGTGVRIEDAAANYIGHSNSPLVRFLGRFANLISGNREAGVEIVSSSANRVQGNRVGTNASGTVGLGNENGIVLDRALANSIGMADNQPFRPADNVISGNRDFGVKVINGSTGNHIVRNVIGWSADATVAVPNRVGVGVFDSLSNHIGLAAFTSSPNRIGQNIEQGIIVERSADNFIELNYVTGNGSQGVLIQGGAENHIEVNDITANAGAGVTINDGHDGPVFVPSIDMHVVRNRIDNNGFGVHVVGGQGTKIHDDTIKDNGIGVWVTAEPDPNRSTYEVKRCRISDNPRGDLVTPDSTVVDIDVSSSFLGSVHVEGTLHGAPDSDYDVEFFASSSAGAGGLGSAELYLGSRTFTTDAAGDAIFHVDFDDSIPPTWYVTTTVTPPDGDTSRFSPPSSLIPAPPANEVSVDDVAVEEGDDGGKALVFTLTRRNFSDTSITVRADTADGSATVADGDYQPLQDVLVAFPAGGPIKQQVTVLINGDEAIEPDEMFALNLTNVSGASIGRAGVGTILDDDGPIYVTTTADSGAGSLRQAIITANTRPGPDKIFFNIPGAGVQTIAPSSFFPPITEAVVIDGYTQPGAHPNTLAQGDDAQLLIELSGENLPVDLNDSSAHTPGVIHLSGGSSTVRGLVFNRFFTTAIYMDGAGGNRIEGNFVGTDPTGSFGHYRRLDGSSVIIPPNRTEDPPYYEFGNHFFTYGIGIENAGGNSIGGTMPAERNLILTEIPLFMGLLAGGGDVVQGNYIGSDASGTAFLGGYTIYAIHIRGGGNLIGGTEPGAGNLIAHPIAILGEQNSVQGNLIGTDITGTRKLETRAEHFDGRSVTYSLDFGIDILGDNNTIGGTSPGAGNVIAGFNDVGSFAETGYLGENSGIWINSSGNVVQGNFIGTNKYGTAAISNIFGIIIDGRENLIGGTNPEARNIISGNVVDGIALSGGTSAAYNLVQGNLIGTDVTGRLPLGNGYAGVYFEEGLNNLIGGTESGAANVIAFNGGIPLQGETLYHLLIPGTGRGVVVENSDSGTAILGNSISSNEGQGIDLGNDEVTPNDPQDSDGFQNFPVLDSATIAGAGTTIAGTLSSRPSATFRVEFVSNSARSHADLREGENYLGSIEVTTNDDGNRSFSFTAPVAVPAGQFVSATATALIDDDADPATPLVPRDTSEFSQSVAVRLPDNADVLIGVERDSAIINAGETAGFTFTVHNDGVGDAGGVTLSAPLPAGLADDIRWQIDTSTGDADLFQINGLIGSQVLVLKAGASPLLAGQLLTVHITGVTSGNDTTTNTLQGTLACTATVNADNEPADAQNDQASTSITVNSPDVQVSLSPDGDNIDSGEMAGFTLTIGNQGLGATSGLALFNALPGGRTDSLIWTIDPAVGDPSAFAIGGAAGEQFLSLAAGAAALAVGQVLSVHITAATGPDEAGVLSNAAIVDAANEPDSQRNDYASSTIVVNVEGIFLSLAADSDIINAGATAGFTLTVRNEHPINEITLSNALPAGLGNDVNWQIDPTVGTPAMFAITGPVGGQMLSLVSNETLMGPGQILTVHITGITNASDTSPDTRQGILVNTATIDFGSALLSPKHAEAMIVINQVTGMTTQTAVAIVSSDANSIYGQEVTFTATVSALGSPALEPTGLLQFQIDGADFAAPLPLSGRTADIRTAGLPAGEHRVTAAYASNSPDFENGSTSTALIQSVAQARLDVRAADKSRLYGAPNPPFTVSYAGFVLGEDESVLSGTLTFATPAISASNVGSYFITPGGLSSTNYHIELVDGTLAVTPAPLAVSAADDTRVYGDDNPTFHGTLTGVKNGDPITVVYTTVAGPGSSVGNYMITPTLLDPDDRLVNYTVTHNLGILKVDPVPLEVRADDKNRVYGAPNPQFTATYTGFVLNEGPSVLGGTLVVSTPAGSSSPVGPYAIIPAGLTSLNYVLHFVNGTLTIRPAATTTQLISSVNPSVLGQAVTFTATISAVAPGSGIPTGGVTFSDGGNVLGIVALNGGQAAWTSATLTAGSHTIGAAYSGDGNFTFSTSQALVQVVNTVAAGTPGKITGGGSIDSGVRNFGFVVQGKSQGTSLSFLGNLEFHDRANGYNLHSTAISLLGIDPDGIHGTFSGTATLNGTGDYTFTVQVEDRGEPGPGVDKFRIQIAGPGGFNYDSNSYASRGGLLDRGGNIQVHKNSGSALAAPLDVHDVLLAASVVGRRIFYNNSVWDGSDLAANPSDDNAIASDKAALLPGQTATLANYTSYSKGLNGIMIDVAGLAGTITAADFAFKTGNVNATNTWTVLATAPSVSIRPGAGTGGSTRVMLTWPDGTVAKKWLQVTVNANANTGLPSSDVFYFGNAVGEAGNSATDTQVNAADELAARGNPRNIANPAPITFRYDYNRDKQVNAADQLIARANPTNLATRLQLITPTAAGAPGAAGLAEAALHVLELDDDAAGAFAGSGPKRRRI